MKARVLLLLALLAGTAFAPAPLPKPRRVDPNAVSLASVQGDWRVVSFEEIIGPNDLRQSIRWFTGVRIKGDQFTYLNGDDDVTAEIKSFGIVIDGNKRPAATIDFFEDNKDKDPCYVGIVRRQGNRFSILLSWDSQTWPTSFENIPRNWRLLEPER